MSFYYVENCPFDDMDEEEYYFYQNQQMNEDWQWCEYQRSLDVERQSQFDEEEVNEIGYDCDEKGER
jgi:hypothetical protein